MIIRQDIAASFARQGLMKTFGATLRYADQGRCVIEAPISAAVSQQQGAAHAGLSFAIGDSACGYAALTMMPEGSDVVTVEMKINLLSMAVGDRLRATGVVQRAGRRIVVTTGEVHAVSGANEKLVALLQGTMVPV